MTSTCATAPLLAPAPVRVAASSLGEVEPGDRVAAVPDQELKLPLGELGSASQREVWGRLPIQRPGGVPVSA